MYDINIDSRFNSFQVWSERRLPFEPKGILQDMKKDIRKAFYQLDGGDSSFINAVYSSPIKEFCDVENVLFYNIGSRAFQHISKNGVSFERRFTLPPQNPQTVNYKINHHYYYYVNGTTQPSSYWKKVNCLAHWEQVPIPKLTSDIKPEHIWFDIKQANIDIKDVDEKNQYFGMDLTITVPFNKSAHIISVMKPLLDGIISAFHSHDGKDVELVSKRLGNRLKLSNAEQKLQSLLLSQQFDVLGNRTLVRPYRTGIMWNPADDKFVRVDIKVNQSDCLTDWRLSGSLYGLIEV